ncbi:MAG: alpha-glucan family phosphorylase [Desulfoprunum sp.]|nr:alpha-glucan family phosphorylase [Desulfoprunum sp.]
MNEQTPPSTDISCQDMLAVNDFGVFFGVSQETLDRVWNQLTHPSGNSVVYISMEIGADPDVYNPIKERLLKNPPAGLLTEPLQEFTNRFLHGPQKIPNYSGGLGILAGDTLKSYADCRIPVVAVSLLYRKGYFSQFVDSQLGQISRKVDWHPEATPGLYLLKDPDGSGKPLQIDIPFLNEYDQETVASAQVWMKMEVNSSLDFFIPEILLDFYLPETPRLIRSAAAELYNSESSMIKAIQRRMLGTGILPALQALGFTSKTFHLNEQHGVVLAIQLIAEELHHILRHNKLTQATNEQILLAAEIVSKRLVYTIHTPVKAGHDRFNKSLYSGISHASCQRILELLAHDEDNLHSYNFTNMAMHVNRSANSVSRLHRDVTHRQFPQFAHKISAITNGVHHLTWISDARAEIFDDTPQLTGWRHNPGVFAKAGELGDDKNFKERLQKAWRRDSQALIDYVNEMLLLHRNQMAQTWIDPPNYLSTRIADNVKLQSDVFTVGFARRFSTYKRADLIFNDIEKLCHISLVNNWPINFLFAGKAHPADEPGKTVIKRILDLQEELYRKSNGLINLVFIPNYDMKIAKLLVSGVHSWLNCPKRPLEASGTSGMKAAMNGVPNISIMDGWWVEGYHDGATGWKFGHEGPIDSASLSESREELLYFEDSSSFYLLLPLILKDFYDKKKETVFIDKGMQNLLLNIPIFNTHRMAAEYLQRYELILPEDQAREMKGFAQLYSSDI